MSRYIFVDGNYLREAFGRAIGQFFGTSAPIDFGALLRVAESQKLFYYDSVDAQPHGGETAAETAARVAAADAELDRIQATSGCHVREGTVTGRAQRRRRQKQVDVLLAVDMLTHASRRNFERAVLLAGDLDFKPVVDALVSLGTFIEVWYERQHAADDLLAAADLRRELTLRELYAIADPDFRDTHKLPQDGMQSHRADYKWPVERKGTLKDQRCFIGHHGASPPYTLVVERYDGRLDLHSSYHDPDKLALYVSMVFGEITWE